MDEKNKRKIKSYYFANKRDHIGLIHLPSGLYALAFVDSSTNVDDPGMIFDLSDGEVMSFFRPEKPLIIDSATRAHHIAAYLNRVGFQDARNVTKSRVTITGRFSVVLANGACVVDIDNPSREQTYFRDCRDLVPDLLLAMLDTK